MNDKIKDIIIQIAITIIMFITSFCDFNGIYFILCVPLVCSLVILKNRYFLNAYLGMLFASLLIPGRTHLIVITTTLAAVYLVSIIISKFKLKPIYHISILGLFFGFSLSWMFHFSPFHAPLINFILVPCITMFLTYNIANIAISLKSRENFSLRKMELAFLSFVIVAMLFSLDKSIFGFRINLFAILIGLYILARVDSSAAIIACLATIAFKIPTEEYLRLFLIVTPLVFIYKSLYLNKYLGFGLYLILNGLVIFYFKDYSYIKEVLPASLIMMLIPENLISTIQKYIIEPQDYQLKLFQKNYYRCMNKNKKIQETLTILETKIANDKKMKQVNKNLIMENIYFLGEKLKEEENIYLKDTILNDLTYKNADVIGLKIYSDLLENYKIILEVKNSQISLENIIQVLEYHLNIKLKKASYSYDYVIGTHRYTIVNDQKLKFNLCIKQRSKESNYCGDSYLTFDMKNKKYLLISDGMGHGKKASKESTQALNILRNFLELGINPEKAISCCNALLFDKNKENFNTLDLLEYDYFDNEIKLYKNGSGVTYLKKGNEVEKIVSENLPLGIVENISVNRLNISSDTKFIVMTSDGIKKDFTDTLRKTKAKNSKSLTQELISYEGEGIDDDQTIMVINVIKAI